jgi:membrane protein YdbS with pleckstrin-like domain
VGKYYILSERRIQTETETGPVEKRFTFRNLALLDAGA